MKKDNIRDEFLSLDGLSKLWRSPLNKYYTREMVSDTQIEITKSFPLYVHFAHEEHCFKNYYRRREKSELFAVELVLKGAMNFIQNDKKYTVKAGEVFLVQSDQNSEFSTGKDGYCQRLACCISGHLLSQLLNYTRLSSTDVIKLHNVSKLEKLMRMSFDELKCKNAGFRHRCSVLAYEILLELAENIRLSKKPKLLNLTIELLENHLSHNISVKDIASALNSSPTSINRIFQKHLNTTPIKYFINLKMENAKSLLLDSNLQIKEIAQRLGYKSPFYFSREFHRIIGIPPREFRKKHIISY